MNYKTLAVWGLNNSGLVNAYGNIRKLLTGSQLAILVYHRVGPNVYPWSLPAVKPSAFERHLAYVKNNFVVLSIIEIANLISEKRALPKKAVAITFDDGYKDFYLYAYPLLKKYNIPGSIFLTSSHINNNELFWWDRVGYYIKHCKLEAIEIPEMGELYLKSDTQRQQAYKILINTLKNVNEDKKQNMINCLVRKTMAEEPRGLGEQLILNWQEVRIMSDNGIDIGSHTATHSILTKLPITEAEKEIMLSKKEIENNIQKQVLSFSYPNGDYNASLTAIVRKYGYKCAATVDERFLNNNEDPYELPRISTAENMNNFKMSLMGCISDLKKLGISF